MIASNSLPKGIKVHCYDGYVDFVKKWYRRCLILEDTVKEIIEENIELIENNEF